MKILVTGASGLVGLHLTRYLVAKGHTVVALIRSSSQIVPLQELLSSGHLTIESVELNKIFDLSKIMTGCDVVVHTAAVTDPFKTRQEIFAVNVNGTKSVVEAAISASVKQLVHISSLSVITGRKDQFGTKEEARLQVCGEPYGDSKVAAERYLYSQKGRLAITILRPGFIYGPEEHSWLPRLISSISSGKVMLIDGGQKETNVIYVENLCRAIDACLLNKVSFNQTYNLTDGKTPTKKELFDTIAQCLNLPPVTRSIPSVIAYPFCECISSLASIMPINVKQNLARYSRAAFRLAGLNQGFDISRAERELGYVNCISFAQGMSETLKHYQTIPSNKNDLHAGLEKTRDKCRR